MVSDQSKAISTEQSDRWESLDLIRGGALLGILVMNIQSFGLPAAAYMNPAAFGDLTGWNLYAWICSHIFFDSKFMAIFSMLFGAGIVLFTERAEQRGRSPLAMHVRRNLWLVLFGLLHAHLLWFGDILFSYGICALLIYPFRRLTPRSLIMWALFLILLGSAINVFAGLTFEHWPENDRIKLEEEWQPAPAEISEEVALLRGTFTSWQPFMSSGAFVVQTFIFWFFILWRTCGMMLLGMALFKSGILIAQGSRQAAKSMMLLGLSLGLALSAFGVWKNLEHGFSVDYSQFLGSQWNYWGSIATALGIMGTILLWNSSDVLPKWRRALCSLGRMAFTMYILQTILAIFIFRGEGFAQFAQLERWQLLVVVVAIWVFQLLLATAWMKRYQFGPLEWLWRSLTYWKQIPIRKPKFDA